MFTPRIYRRRPISPQRLVTAGKLKCHMSWTLAIAYMNVFHSTKAVREVRTKRKPPWFVTDLKSLEKPLVVLKTRSMLYQEAKV